MKNNKGFSLVELIVVIAIMAILAAVAIPTFAHFIKNANEASDEQYYADVVYAVELANAKFDLTVAGVEITVANGKATQVTYDLCKADGTVVKNITITVGATTSAVCDDCANCDYDTAADDVDKVINLYEYNFKSTKYAYGINADGALSAPSNP